MKSSPDEILGQDGEVACGDYVGFLLNQSARLIREQTAVALAPLGINPRQFGILETIGSKDENPLTQHNLGALLGIDRTTVVALRDALEGAGFVVRQVNPADRRAHLLRLSEIGEATRARACDLVLQVQNEFLSALSDSEQRQLVTTLQRVLTDAGANV